MYHDSPRFFITPMLSVHHDELYLYGRKEWINDPPPHNANSLNNLQLNYHHNKLSDTAKRKAKRAIKYMLYSSGEKKVFNPKFNSSFTFKVGFITLTLPSEQQHTDQEIKSICLNQFLIEASKKWGLQNYVWKAERQGNGNIHFHILCDKFIPHQELRQVWNRIINKLGYVDRYQSKHNKRNPNSTDIHSLYKIKNIAAYITKYMTKNEGSNRMKIKAIDINYTMKCNKDKRIVSIGAKKYLMKLSSTGKIWACSRNLSNIEGGKHELEGVYEQEIEKLKAAKRTRVINKDYVTCIYFDKRDLNIQLTPHLYNLLLDYIQKTFDTQTKQITYPPLPPDN